MIVTISGKPGSGKSTVAKLVAKKLGYRYEDIGHMRRKLAEERGMTLEELNRVGEKERWTDDAVDEYQRKIGQEADNLVISGRTSFHFIPKSVKVFLDVEEGEGVRRIHASRSAERKTEDRKFGTVEEVKRSLRERVASDLRRYERYYNVNVYDPKQYDLVVDTTGLSIEQVVDRVFSFIQQH